MFTFVSVSLSGYSVRLKLCWTRNLRSTRVKETTIQNLAKFPWFKLNIAFFTCKLSSIITRLGNSSLVLLGRTSSRWDLGTMCSHNQTQPDTTGRHSWPSFWPVFFLCAAIKQHSHPLAKSRWVSQKAKGRRPKGDLGKVSSKKERFQKSLLEERSIQMLLSCSIFACFETMLGLQSDPKFWDGCADAVNKTCNSSRTDL